MSESGNSVFQLLAKSAKAVFPIIMQCGIQGRERLAGQVGTRLGQIAQESFPAYLADASLERAAEDLLLTLLSVCMWPKSSKQQVSVNDVFSSIMRLAQSDNETKLKRSVFDFVHENKISMNKLKQECDAFIAKLNKGAKDETQFYLQPKANITEPVDYPSHVNKNLFEILYGHAACNPDHSRGSSDSTATNSALNKKFPKTKLHSPRLHLDGISKPQNNHVQFEIVISCTDMRYWQEFRVDIPAQTRSHGRSVRFELGNMSETGGVEDGDRGHTQSSFVISPGSLCRIIQHTSYARIHLRLVEEGMRLVSVPPPSPLERFLRPGEGLQLSAVLKLYKLTDKDKIILSHAVAHSFWRFYASDLMRRRWGSQDIWFMEESDEPRLALRAYIPVVFEGAGEIPEFLDDPMITHPFPHILALGIILLDIGLSLFNTTSQNLQLSSRLNRDHGAAKQRLNQLEKLHWTRPMHGQIFVRVVANCLDPKIFMKAPTRRPKLERMGGSVGVRDAACETEEVEINERRRRVYQQVVEPLSRLVHTGFRKDDQYVSYMSRCRYDEEACGGDYSEVAAFHAGRDVIPHEWLDNLKHISRHVKQLQRKRNHETFEPVRIAILDTGYDAGMSFFKAMAQKDCIKDWKDFVDDNVSYRSEYRSRDDFGHGSLMARLVIESAPLAHVYIARVAKNTNELAASQKKIAKAIRWAGIDKHVDIISMSFGFADHDDDISAAIDEVEHQNVICFASAGNNAAYQNETFPARHRSVISIRATNCHGVFSQTNPPIADRGRVSVLGTFGESLPDRICEEMGIHFSNDICRPGSSIATAVAAGIAATTIAYAEALSVSLPIPRDQSPVRSLKTMEGMSRMLEKMAPDQTGHYRFINPIWFWNEKADAWKSWATIYDSVSQLIPQRKPT